MVVVEGFPMDEKNLLFQPVHQCIGQHHKLLVGGGVDEHLQSRPHQYLFQPLCHVDGMTRDTVVEPVGEEGVELHAG